MATRKEPGDVHRITSAAPALSDDQAGRQRRYLISMTIRTVCFLGAVFTQGPLRWTLIAGALVLPYLAVVIANAGRENGTPHAGAVVPPSDRFGLPGAAPTPLPPSADPGATHPRAS